MRAISAADRYEQRRDWPLLGRRGTIRGMTYSQRIALAIDRANRRRMTTPATVLPRARR